MQTIVSAVAGYFFRPGFKYQFGISRISLFIGVLWTIVNQIALFSPLGWPSDYVQAYPEFYSFGIMRLFDGPPLGLLDACAIVGPIAALLAIVGLFTRPAMIVSTLSAYMLVLAREGVDRYWSHGYPVIFFCAMPFMFSRAGAVLSLDSLLYRRFGWWPFGRPAKYETEYSWPVVSGLIGSSALFYGAFWAKLVNGGAIAWWNSDNLRFDLAATWLAYDRMTVPWYVEWMWSTPWVWKTASLLHLVMQIAPVAALFSLSKPRARAVEGCFYVASVAGLGIIMGLWHLPWLMLTVFFIDWDRLFTGQKPSRRSPIIVGFREAKVLVPLLAFLAVMHAVFLFQMVDTRLYPFTPLQFYSSVRAQKPYSEHKSYPGRRCEFTITVPSCEAVGLPDERQSRGQLVGAKLSRDDWSCSGGEIRFRYFNLAMARSCERAITPEGEKLVLEKARSMLMTLQGAVWQRMPWRYSVPVPSINPDAISMYYQDLVFPAYPAQIDPVVVNDGMKATLSRDGVMRTVTGRIEGNVFHISAVGFGDAPKMEVLYRSNVFDGDGKQAAMPLPGHWDGNNFVIDMASVKRTAYLTVVVHADGRDYVFSEHNWQF
jgi:hypothetical protein